MKTRSFFCIFPLVLTFWVFPVLNKRMALENFNCTCQAPICTSVNSSYTKIEPYKYRVSVGGFIAQRSEKFDVRLKKLLKKGRSWTPTNIDITFDFCQFTKGMKVPLVDIFLPGIRQLFEATFRTCPFQGSFYVGNYTVSPPIFPTNSAVGTQFKVEITFSNEKYLTFFNCYLYTKVYGA